MSGARLVVGIDNGVTGSIGFVRGGVGLGFCETPARECLDYTRSKKRIRRVDVAELARLVRSHMDGAGVGPEEVLVVLERPLVNPSRFAASVSAVRAYEATLVVVEGMGLPHTTIDSRRWQRTLLPDGVSGSADLKRASADVGARLFPQFSDMIRKHKDADGVLMALYGSRSL